MASWGNCRYYEGKLPELDQVVMVNIKQCTEMGVYVKLLEYDNIDGMILLSELSRRRIRSMQKLVRVGNNEVVVVIRVDKDKGYIDLSKRRVTPEDIVKCRERFQKVREAHSILRHVAEKSKMPVMELYETVAWPLARRYGSAVDAFKMSIAIPGILNEAKFSSPLLKEELVRYIATRLSPHPTKLRADVEVQCFGYEGIDAVKAALFSAEAVATETTPLKVKLVAPPLYVINSLHCFDRDEGIRVMNKAIDAIKRSIEAVDGGSLRVVMEPKVVSSQDDERLKELMEKRARENMEVSGDEDTGSEIEIEIRQNGWNAQVC